ELELLRKQERAVAIESSTMSEAVLSNLGSGEVLFNSNRLVRHANPAARALLGYASPSSLHARDVFKGISAVRFTGSIAGSDSPDACSTMVTAVDTCLREGTLFRRIECDYTTPAGEKRVLGVTLSLVRNAKGVPLAAA